MILKRFAKGADNRICQTNTEKHGGVNLVAVAKIEIEPNEDVYNMEVMGTHNFAVNGGVIVHNCMDDIRYFVNTVLKNKVGKERYNPVIFR